MGNRIVIDFRMHMHSGIGTYIRNLIPFLVKKFRIVLLGNSKEIEQYTWADSVEDVINATSKVYTLSEHFEFFSKIPKCDIFWSPHYNIPILPIRAKKRSVTIHDVFHLAFYSQLTLKQKIYAKFMLNQAVRKSDIIITVSNFSAEEIKKYTKTSKNINVIYNGVDFEKFKPIKNERDLEEIKQKYNLPSEFVLYVGNVKPHKNLRNLILAIKDLNVKLVVIGKKEGFITTESGIFDMIKSFDMENKVLFTGYIQEEDLPKVYNLAKIFAFPSLYEGFGLPPIEAMACGCPVLCSNIPSLNEVCSDAAYYINPYNPRDIAKGIDTLMKDESIRKQLVEKGFENVKRFSWEKASKQIIHLFESVINH